eukprot:COSAG05_NODE_3960_length_1751_cov_1.531477_1_plen_336_part_01
MGEPAPATGVASYASLPDTEDVPELADRSHLSRSKRHTRRLSAAGKGGRQRKGAQPAKKLPTGRLGRRNSLGYIVNSRGEQLLPHAMPDERDAASKEEREKLQRQAEMQRERWRLNVVFWISTCLIYCSVVALILDKNTAESDLPPMWARNSKVVQQVAVLMLTIAVLLFLVLLVRAMYMYETWRPDRAIRNCATKANCMTAACATMAAYGTLCVIVLSTLPYFVWYCFAHEVQPHLVTWWVSGVFALLATVLSMHTIWGHVKHGRPPKIQGTPLSRFASLQLCPPVSCSSSRFLSRSPPLYQESSPGRLSREPDNTDHSLSNPVSACLSAGFTVR